MNEIRKVDIEQMIDILTMLYNTGLNYIDITGEQGEETDTVTFSFTKEYIDDEYKDKFDLIPNETIHDVNAPPKKYTLSDDDINQMI